MFKLTRLSVSGFKALDRFSMAVEPSITVLVGMNGAGKSSILQVFSFAWHLVQEHPDIFFEERGWDRKSLRFRGARGRSTIVRIGMVFQSEIGLVRWTIRWGLNSGRLRSEKIEFRENLEVEPATIFDFDWQTGGSIGTEEIPALQFKGSLLSAITNLSLSDKEKYITAGLMGWVSKMQSLELLSPAAMKGVTRLSPSGMGPRGERIAGFLAALTPDQRSRVVQRVARFYPLNQMETVRKRAGWIDLVLSEAYLGMATIPAAHMSDGFMRLLALCAIPEMNDVSAIFLDEVEDGIEPHILGRLIELVARETEAQIIATTHSPILANVVGANALRFISRNEDGRTIAAKVTSLPAFDVGAEYLGAGDLWANTEMRVLQQQVIASAIGTGEDQEDPEDL